MPPAYVGDSAVVWCWWCVYAVAIRVRHAAAEAPIRSRATEEVCALAARRVRDAGIEPPGARAVAVVWS